jgi:hypothetical protein
MNKPTDKGPSTAVEKEWCEDCAGLGDWWEGPLGERVHVACKPCNGAGFVFVQPPEKARFTKDVE